MTGVDGAGPGVESTIWAFPLRRRLFVGYPILFWCLVVLPFIALALKSRTIGFALGSTPWLGMAFFAWRMARPSFLRLRLRAGNVLSIVDVLAPWRSFELGECLFRSPLVGLRHRLRMPATVEVEGVDPENAEPVRIVITGTDRPGKDWPRFFRADEAVVLELFAQAESMGMTIDEPSRTIPRETFAEHWVKFARGWRSHREMTSTIVQLIPFFATGMLVVLGFFRALMLLSEALG